MDNISFKKMIMPFFVLAIGLAITFLLISNPDTAKKNSVTKDNSILVETEKIESGDYSIKIEAMGQIIPAMQVDLKPQLSGEIIKVENDFIPGGFFKTGDPILYIDPEDYQIAKRKQEAIVKQIKADLQIEMGRQSIAKSELDILSKNKGKKISKTSLALRKPQLEQANAELEKAVSDLELAKLNLERTTIYSPFNALVTQRNATMGDKISAQSSVATLVNTDEYWVKISVPIYDLRWINIPSNNGNFTVNFAKIIMDGGRGERDGYLLKMTGTLDSQSRLADMIVAVPDPLLIDKKDENNQSTPLILGDYVKVILEGKTITNAIRLPLNLLRDGNIVWVLEGDKMRFREVTLAYEDKNYAYITSGLGPDDIVIKSNIPVPIDGMSVRTSH